MKIRKKALALLMALIMMLSLVPAYALADDEAAAPAAEEAAAEDEASSALTADGEDAAISETVSEEMPALDATAPADEFTMERVPGGTQKDVIANGEQRVIYCMQYDYLWPVTGEGYANRPTKYTEAAAVELLTDAQQAVIQRVLYAGYPYDSVGVLEPLYANLDTASAAGAASDMTQAVIWSFMAEWGIEGNSHYHPLWNSTDSEIPGWNEAYNALVAYANGGTSFTEIPTDFTPALTGSTTFAKHGDSWKTDALTITDPDGFKVMYHVTVPDGVVLLDADGYELFPNYDFVNGGWVNLGYTVYGGDTFYLQTEHGPSVEGETISFGGSVRLPANIKQYNTKDTGLGDKHDGQGYIQHRFQTMLSVGIDSVSFDGDATLHAAEETVTVSGHKTWIHGNNPVENRPDAITVHLHANGELKEVKTVTPDADGNWAWSFDDLPKYDESGAEIAYTVDEGYVHDYSAGYHGYNITNTYTPAKTSINVEKHWEDDHDHDGLRPGSVTVRLLADGIDTGKTVVLTDVDNWRGVFEDLAEKNPDGSTVVYTVEESPVDGYTASSQVQTDAEGRTTGFVITNTHAPEFVSVSGSKTWNHGNNPEDQRPTSITVFLHADGIVKDAKTVTAADNWAWSFTDLPKYDHGTEIVYTVSEESVPNYTASYAHNSYDITNTYAPEMTSVSVNKVWSDDHDRDGIRPESVTVHLLANLQPTDKTLILNEENRWEDDFTGLNIFDADGNEIHYSVTEEAVEGYKTAITGSEAAGYIITNTHAPETVTVKGQKVWADANDKDGLRPDSIVIHILANGEKAETLTLSEDTGWDWEIEGLPKNEKGAAIVYTVTEDEVESYKSTVTGSLADGFTVTNRHTPVPTRPTDPVTPTKDTTSPQTADNSNLTLWFALLLTGSCALAGVFVHGRRKNRFE